ncbi:hypothetical protein OEZ86_007844 [Tetradesmus obliquus]|nr:hypothetical protein OEZ86_007844 [Tetradesmus obliquus]
MQRKRSAAAQDGGQLPPIILKSQLYTVLADKTAVDRDVEQLRQQGRARLFKLAFGADEYVVLLTQDYLRLVDGLITQHSQAAQQLQHEEQQQARAKQQQQQQQQDKQQEPQRQGEDEGNAAPSSTTSSAEHAAMAATLQAFRSRVLPSCRDSHITSSRLLQLMQTAPAAAAGQAQQSKAPAAAGLGSAEVILRRLLSAELVCRDRHAPDSLMFTVPGAAAFVKSVVAGRQELLQMLKRKKYQEVLEKELMCVALRGSCLTPAFHVRDLQGRGLVACMDTTAGRLVRLAQRK